MRIREKTSVSSGLIVALSFLGPAHSAHSAAIEFINNGGFETGDLSGWSEPAVNPNPWMVVSDNALTGTYSAFNPASPSAIAATTLYQSFSPIVVENIESAGFWYFHEGGTGSVGLATLLTFSDGSSVQDTLFAIDPAYQQNVWAFRDLMPTLLANAGMSLVEIGFFPKGGGAQYIDDVSIRAVPIPAAVFLYMSGLIGVLGLATQSRRTGH